MKLNLVVIAVSALWVASELALIVTKRSQRLEAESADKGSQRILWITIVASIVTGVFVATSGIGGISGAPGRWGIAGLTMILVGLAIRWLAILTLKKSFTVDVAIAPDQRIIQTGIYRFVRHPSYTGSLVSFLGLGIAFANWLSILIIVVPITLAFLFRVHIEEAALHRAFGDEYSNYMRHTRRFLPFLFTPLS